MNYNISQEIILRCNNYDIESYGRTIEEAQEKLEDSIKKVEYAMGFDLVFSREYLAYSVDSRYGSIFLAGPTPRDKNVISWRPDALKLLNLAGFKGTVYIPEERGSDECKDFDGQEQIKWEQDCLDEAKVILFWIPRDLDTMPGFTTNIEFGYWYGKCPEKLVIGIPDFASKTGYIRYCCNKAGISIQNCLCDAVCEAARKACGKE